ILLCDGCRVRRIGNLGGSEALRRHLTKHHEHQKQSPLHDHPPRPDPYAYIKIVPIYAVWPDADTTSLSRSPASSSTANDCMMQSIETTILNFRVCFTMTPSKPRRGPTLIRTLLP